MLTPRRSSVWSFILLCLEKLSQKCLLVNWRYFGISSKNEEQILDILIIFVRKLYFVNFVKPLKPQSVFKKYIWVHFTLHCEQCRWIAWNYSVDYRKGHRAPASKTKLLVSIVYNFQPLTIFTKNSILDTAAPKLYSIYFAFVSNGFFKILFMYFRSIQKILSNWYKIRKSIELHWKPIDVVFTW